DHDHVLDVAEPGAAVLLGEDDAEEAQLAELRHHLARELLRLVDLLDDGVDLAAGELAHRLLDVPLLRGEREADAGRALGGLGVARGDVEHGKGLRGDGNRGADVASAGGSYAAPELSWNC